MSKKWSRRQFLQLAGTTTLAGVVAACAKPAAEPTQKTAATEAPKATAAPTATQAPAETVILDYYWVANSDTDQRSLVEAAINEYVEPLIGVNVVFHLIGWGDWETKAVTGLQAGEKIDIFFTADWYFYMQLATEGLFAALNDDNGPNGNRYNGGMRMFKGSVYEGGVRTCFYMRWPEILKAGHKVEEFGAHGLFFNICDPVGMLDAFAQIAPLLLSE